MFHFRIYHKPDKKYPLATEALDTNKLKEYQDKTANLSTASYWDQIPDRVKYANLEWDITYYEHQDIYIVPEKYLDPNVFKNSGNNFRLTMEQWKIPDNYGNFDTLNNYDDDDFEIITNH